MHLDLNSQAPIQRQAILPMLKNKDNIRSDIIAQAQSGTGKTGAFTIASLQIINEKEKKTQGMILAPTHELANQIKDTLDGLSIYLKIKTQLLIGGSSVDKDKDDLENNVPRIVIGTPGRINDLIRKFLKQKI